MEVKNNLLNYSGKVIYQNNNWFNFSLDSVLLANFVDIRKKDKNILDLATGNAPIPMLLTYKTNAKIIGIDVQKEVIELGTKSIEENKMSNQITLIHEDINNLLNVFIKNSIDIITCNPPYFKYNENSNVNNNSQKTIARHEKLLQIENLLSIVSNLLKENGSFCMVHRTERFVEILDLLRKNHLQPKKIQFIHTKKEKNSIIFLIEAKKNGKQGIKMLPPLIIHDNKGNYTNNVKKMFGE